MGARYYDAALGRFISADTVIASLANPQSLNRYSYVYNNPVNNTDPTGHRPIGDEDYSGSTKPNKGTNGPLANKDDYKTDRSGSSSSVANKTHAKQISGGNFYQPAGPDANNPNNGMLITVSREFRFFVRAEAGGGSPGWSTVGFLEWYLGEPLTGGVETGPVGGLGPIEIQQVIGASGPESPQVSIRSPLGPVLQSQGSKTAIGMGATIGDSSTLHGQGALLAGMNEGLDKYQFITSRGYFDSVGPQGFVDKNVPGAQIVSIVEYISAPETFVCDPSITWRLRITWRL